MIFDRRINENVINSRRREAIVEIVFFSVYLSILLQYYQDVRPEKS
jgi:hypothetical protein